MIPSAYLNIAFTVNSEKVCRVVSASSLIFGFSDRGGPEALQQHAGQQRADAGQGARAGLLLSTEQVGVPAGVSRLRERKKKTYFRFILVKTNIDLMI